ncbi:MAG: 50S ribosomal protein L4 [Candidatus Dependentiae bacterium]
MIKKKETAKTKEQTTASEIFAVIQPNDLEVAEALREISPKAFSTYVRVLNQNWRQGTVACKDRSEVNFSNKKPWKQKGTGRARAGSPRSPLWRKGGVVFGPQERTRTLKINKDIRKGALVSLLQERLNHGKIGCLNWALETEQPKTAVAYSALKNAGLNDKNITLFLSANDFLNYASFINIPNVSILFFDQPNAVDLAVNSQWVFLKKDMDQFKEMVSRWL